MKSVPIYQETPVEIVAKKGNSVLLAEGLLAIAFFKTIYLEKMIEQIDPDALDESLRSLYSKLIIYYTKHHNLSDFTNHPELSEQEKEDWIRLAISGENNYAEVSEKDIANDWQNFVFRLKEEYLDAEKNKLIKDLQQAELSNDTEIQNQLAHKINLLNKELHKLQS